MHISLVRCVDPHRDGTQRAAARLPEHRKRVPEVDAHPAVLGRKLWRVHVVFARFGAQFGDGPVRDAHTPGQLALEWQDDRVHQRPGAPGELPGAFRIVVSHATDSSRALRTEGGAFSADKS